MLREITMLCDERTAEAFGDLMMDAGAMSVTIEDADRDKPDEQPLFGEPGLEPETLAWSRSRLTLLVAADFDAVTAAGIAARALGIETPAIEKDEDVPDENWVKLTQAQFGPTKVSDRMWIVPSWNEPPEPTAINIRSPSPGAKPYVDVGQKVKAGDTVCIIEAMKLLNEIEAETDGVIQEILVENGAPVEFGQPLFVIA